MDALESGDVMDTHSDVMDSSQTDEPNLTDTTSYDDMDVDQLRERLSTVEAERNQKDKSYRELQSLHDRQYNEQKERSIRMETELNMLKNTVMSQPTEDAWNPEQQAKFEEEWRNKINDKPDLAMDYAQAVAHEVRESILKELDKRHAATRQEWITKDNFYQANKDAVDTIVKEDGVTLEQAISIHKRYTQNSVKQPGIPTPPGRTDTALKPINDTKPVPERPVIPPDIMAVWRAQGFSQATCNKIAAKVAADTQGA